MYDAYDRKTKWYVYGKSLYYLCKIFKPKAISNLFILIEVSKSSSQCS